MAEIKKILCPTDFSEASKRAIDYAVSIAQTFGAEIYFIYVIPVMPHLEPSLTYHFDVPEYERLLKADAQKQLSQLVQSVSTQAKVYEVFGHGDAAEGILKAADERGIDLIVIATAGLTGWQHLVFGSVAEKVVHRARCPVLTVRRP